MADGNVPGVSSLQGRVSAEEWKTRVDLAALYRLAAIEKWDDLLFTHISARIPGPDHHFLINPFGLRFKEVTASSLVKVDLDGNLLMDSPYGINYAGYVIHSAIHAARDDAHYVIHFHTNEGMAVSSQSEGLLPLNQRAMGVLRRLAYHDYEGVAVNLDERERLVADLGDKTLMLLKNHGTLAVGSSPGQAWMGIYSLERCCATQIMALTAGRDRVSMVPDEVLTKVQAPANRTGHNTADLAWAALLRQVAEESPGFDA